MGDEDKVQLVFPVEGFENLLGGALGVPLALALVAGVTYNEWVDLCSEAYHHAKGREE